MKVLKAQRKGLNKLKDIKNVKNWAKVLHPGSENLPRGVYRICPCCAGPYLIKEEKEKSKDGETSDKHNI